MMLGETTVVVQQAIQPLRTTQALEPLWETKDNAAWNDHLERYMDKLIANAKRLPIVRADQDLNTGALTYYNKTKDGVETVIEDGDVPMGGPRLPAVHTVTDKALGLKKGEVPVLTEKEASLDDIAAEEAWMKTLEGVSRPAAK